MSKGLFDASTLPGWPLMEPRVKTAAPAPALATKSKAAPRPPDPASPSWVRTDDDAWRYFEEAAPGAREFFYAREQLCEESGRVPAPAHDLVIVPEAEALRQHSYCTLSARQVIFVERGRATDALPVAEFRRLKVAFVAMRRLRFFRCFLVIKYFGFWAAATKRARYCRARERLAAALFRAQPAFCSHLGQVQALLAGLAELDACGATALAAARRSLPEFGEAAQAWRRDSAGPAVGEAVAALVRVVEAACAGAEQAATAARADTKDSELTDRIGVDLYAATTAARARAMVLIKADKLAKAAHFHASQAQAAALPRFVRLVDLLLGQALATLAGSSCSAAATALCLPEATAQPSQPEASAAVEGAAAGDSGAGAEQQDGAAAGLLVTTVGFASDGSMLLEPDEAAWAAALAQEVVAGSLSLVAAVPPVASLPAFVKYGALTEGASERTTGLVLAEASPQVQASSAELTSIVRGSYAAAEEVGAQFAPQWEVQVFLTKAWDGEAYAAQQRESLDLSRVREDLACLLRWQAGLASLPAGVAAGRLYLDARPLRDRLEVPLGAAVAQICGLLMELGREAARERVEELNRRVAVLAARPAELEDYVGWAAEAQRVCDERPQMAAAAAQVADIWEVLGQAGAVPNTADAVRLDDLREGMRRMEEEAEACLAYLATEAPRQVAVLTAAVAALAEEGVLLEDSLRHGLYVEAGLGAAGEVLADLEVVGERLRQMQASVANLRSLQAALRQPETELSEVAAAAREHSRRVAAWQLAMDLAVLRAAWAAESAAVEAGAGADHRRRRDGSAGDSRESELEPLAARLTQLQAGGSDALMARLLLGVREAKALV